MGDEQPAPGAADDPTRRRLARDSQAADGEREKARRARHGAALIQARPRAHYYHGVVLSLLFALVGTPVLMAPSWVASGAAYRAGEPAPVTVRVPPFLGRAIDDVELRHGSIVVARGQAVEDPGLVDVVRARQPRGWGPWFTFFAGLFMAGLLYTAQLARSHKGRLLRTQIVNLAVILGGAVVTAAVFLLTPASALAVPIAALAIATALVVDLGAALATAMMAALVLGALTPFDPGVITVLAVQGAAAALVVGERERLHRRPTRSFLLLAGVVAGAAAALSYFLIYYLSHNQSPVAELRDPLRSAWLASGVAGPLGALLAIPALPLYQRALGDIPLAQLVELEDLSNPLLKKIAENSPGTWQHSLAMANMAEIAANAIGANGRLVRVGAYYHDLGKSLQPKYFIENLAGGESSPHDALPPGVSCDAIFAHVTEGVRVARKEGLHERIVDFMHMHHGDGLLEYFWAKCVESGNPDKLTEEDFRYPGVKPHSKETAILAICDAVEAASRTLRNPDVQAIENLVQRIVYGKLHLGQLDQSGLTVADLRKISASLVTTIKHAHHGRIEYPWQRQKRAAEEKEAAASQEMATQMERPARGEEEANGDQPSATQRLLREPRLDSLDAPRPAWRRTGSAPLPLAAGRTVENAPTEPMPPAPSRPQTRAPLPIGESHAEPGEITRVLRRPPTAAEVAMATAPEASGLSRLDPVAGPGVDRTDLEISRAIAIAQPVEPAAEPAIEPVRTHRATEPVEAAQIEHSMPAAEMVADPAPAPAPAPASAPEPEPAAPEPVTAELADSISDPMADMASDPVVSSTSEPEASTEWEQALMKVAQTPAPLPGSRRSTPPPPPPGRGKNRLFEDEPDGEEDAVASGHIEVVTRRADSEDEALQPGVLVFGPPPATQPNARRPTTTLRGTAHTVRRPDTPTEPAASEVTVQRRIPIPPEAHADDAEVDADGPTRPRSGLPPTEPE